MSDRHIPCPDVPTGLRWTAPIRDDHDVRLAEQVAARNGLCTYLDAKGGITLIDPSTGETVKSGLTAQDVIAEYDGLGTGLTKTIPSIAIELREPP